ncbi:MAG: DUF1570 domain-containing protein [Planctomycetes bacterium]|nr:DUF1570 domain-containing protein [Planctomycetota bacterium]
MRRASVVRIAAVLFAAIGLAPIVRSAEWTFEFRLANRTLVGTPLNWSDAQIVLLGRDGQLIPFAPNDARQYRKVSDAFRSCTPAEMRAQLASEFGPSFEITATTHYLVVHAAGGRNQWARRFEEIHRAFVHYFSVRGWRVPEPRFPLVAIVFPSQAQYFAYARGTQMPISRDVIGYYAPMSNRIAMYDMASANPNAPISNIETIIHEAAHQTAFNTGMHDRLRPPPRWLVEGLGTLFEAPGVWDPRNHPSPSDRINAYRLERMGRHLPRRERGALLGMISGDRLFESDPDAAYAESWAFSHFLSETRPRQYIEYLRRTANRSSEPVDPVDEFRSVFGANLAQLETHYLRFLQSLIADHGR